MGLIEIIGEWIAPGPIGTVHLERPRVARRSRWLMLTHGVFAVVVLGAALFAIGRLGGLAAIAGIVAVCSYVVLGTVLRPRPDMTNLGWLGGMFDNRLRYSDDANRFLLWLVVLRWPAVFIGMGLLGLFRLRGAIAEPRRLLPRRRTPNGR